MVTRRTFLAALSALSAAGLLPGNVLNGSLFAAAPTQADAEDLTRYVKPFIGTGGHGHTYPGASVPFGMVQLSPDTYNDGWDWCSGYHYSDSSIMGFSHTHLSGTGASDMLDILVMPGTGEAKLVPGTRENPDAGYRSRFSHDDELSQPGYYSVFLNDYKIKAEMTASERVGIHRYTFPKSDSAHFIIDLSHVIQKTPILWSELNVLGNDTISGGRSTNGWAPGREIYFTMKFSKPFAKFELFSDDQKLDASSQRAKGKSLKCLVHFETRDGEAILVKTGISAVGIDGAQKNLDQEVPGFDFDSVRTAAHRAWRDQLSRIRIETANEKHKEIFYTGLFHMMLAPTLFDDVDGRYRGMDRTIHQLPPGAHNYSTFSLWDTYRATHPMYTLFLPERVPDMVNCLVRMAAESPDGMPVWPLQARETGCMTGYHSAAVMGEACVKGFQGIDWKKAYPLMRKRAMDDDYRGLGWYRKLGYIPCDREEESVSKVFEYMYDDWAVARVAEAVSETADAKLLLERSRNYRNVFDKKTTFVRPRLENGTWAEPFDPKGMGHSKKWRDFTESNSWQTTFSIQHDPKGYMELFGGREPFIAKLDALFNQSSDLPADAPSDISGMVGQYAHGNEPSHHIAYLYVYAGAPYKTQARIRSLLETMYNNQPDGMQGNEDCGQMSAWYVMSALGFYSVDPVSGNYVMGTPLFERAVVKTGNGRELIVEARRSNPSDQYVQSVTMNGKPYDKPWFKHADLVRGATITFHMGPEPNQSFGSSEDVAPPSLTT